MPIMSGFQELLNLIDDCLEPKHRPDAGLVKAHNADPLNKDRQITDGASWEEADVVHDILGFLAERMIVMNKDKQAEIFGFLKYLERTLGIAIDSLANKTKLKEYHQHGLGDILTVLKSNKNKLKGFNPQARADQEKLENEFNNSIAKLAPLKAKIEATDRLIDRIVYKLYGLTADEVKVVEGSRLVLM